MYIKEKEILRAYIPKHSSTCEKQIIFTDDYKLPKKESEANYVIKELVK